MDKVNLAVAVALTGGVAGGQVKLCCCEFYSRRKTATDGSAEFRLVTSFGCLLTEAFTCCCYKHMALI